VLLTMQSEPDISSKICSWYGSCQSSPQVFTL